MNLFLFSGEGRETPTMSVLVVRKETTLATEVYKNAPTLADISPSILTVRRM
jgi:hypothetical protein